MKPVVINSTPSHTYVDTRVKFIKFYMWSMLLYGFVRGILKIKQHESYLNCGTMKDFLKFHGRIK